MTSPTADTEATPELGAADNDDALFAALTGRGDAESALAPHLAPDEEPAETPEPAEATDDVEGISEQPEDEDETEDPSEPEAPVADTPADPFAELVGTAKPLTYKVNGQERTLDSILEVEGKGALIPAEKVQDIRNLIARSESNAESNRELYAFKQEVERLGGVKQFEQNAERTAMTDAAATYILDTFLKDPTQFVQVVNGQIVPNQHLLNLAVKESTLKAKEAQWQYRTEREQQATQFREQESVEEVRQTAIPNAIAYAAQQFGLDESDIQAGIAHFAPFADALLFKATPEQAAQYNAKPGQYIVDLPKMEPWFRDRATRKQELSTLTAKREQAQKENVARTAQTAKPAKTPPRNPQNGQFKQAPVEKRKLSMGQLKRLALSGKPIPGDDDYTD